MAGSDRERWDAGFAPEPDAPGRARDLAAAALRDAGVPQGVAAEALLVLGELVSNAVRHARTEFTVAIAVAGGTIRIEVADRDTRPPSLLGLDVDSTSGRGLHIVAGLARDWGWQTDEDAAGVAGKVVWAELDVGCG
jgi:anti-sigma regulatory factor (Ser/Thr protein kinase)